MRIDSRYKRTPLSVDGDGDPGEVTFEADAVAPSALDDPGVHTLITVGSNEQVPRLLGLYARFSGADAANASVQVTLHFYCALTAQWYATASYVFVGTPTTENGCMAIIDGPPGLDYVGYQVDGLAADQDLHMIMIPA